MVDNVRIPSDGAGKRVTTNIYNDGELDYHTQVVSVGDRTNPNNQQTIKPDGAALVEFTTGAPIFNSFNRLLVSSDDLLSAFKFYEGPRAVSTKISEVTTGSANVGFNSTNLSYACSVDSGVGNKAQISSHRRFSYKPGASLTMYFVVGTNAPNQPNQNIRAGMFTDDDGLFFEIENGVINAVIRNSVTGSPVETKITQSSWNGDRLDGSSGDFNRSEATIDLTKMNIFFITYQYLSAGAVTFGTYVNGKPIICHQEGNYGALTSPYMATTYLPHRFEIENTGPGQVGTTDLYTWCSASISDGYTDLLRTPLSFENTVTLTDSTETPVISFRPAETYLGWENRYRYLLQYVDAFSSSEPVMLTLHANTVLANATFTGQNLGLEIDTGATEVLGSLQYGKSICASGATNLIEIFAIGGDASTDGLFRKDNITQTDVWTISARRLSDTGNTNVTVAGSFFQVE